MERWWEDHNNLALIARRMADQGYSVERIIEMLERPNFEKYLELLESRKDTPCTLEE